MFWCVHEMIDIIQNLKVLSSLLNLQIRSFQYETATPKGRIPSLFRRRNRSKAVSSLFLEWCYQFKVSARPVFPDRDVGNHLAFCWRQVADAQHSALCRQKTESDRASCSRQTHVWQLHVTVICLFRHMAQDSTENGKLTKWQPLWYISCPEHRLSLLIFLVVVYCRKLVCR